MSGKAKILVKGIRIMAWMGLLSLLFIMTSAALKKQDRDLIKKVSFNLHHLSDGNDLITLEEIEEKILDTYQIDLRDVKVENLDLENLEEILESEAFIVNAEAYIDSRKRLYVDIDQRIPVLRVMDMKGNNYYLDSEGVRLPMSAHFTARVPIVSGHVTDYQKGVDTLDNSLGSAFRIVKHSRKDPFIESWLDGLNIQSDGEITLLGNVGSFEVIFGTDEDCENKFRKIKSFLTQGLKITGWRDLESINVKFDRQVVTKKKTNA